MSRVGEHVVESCVHRQAGGGLTPDHIVLDACTSREPSGWHQVSRSFRKISEGLAAAGGLVSLKRGGHDLACSGHGLATGEAEFLSKCCCSIVPIGGRHPMPSAFPRVWSWGVPPPSTVPQKTCLSTRGLVEQCVSPGRVNGFAFGRSSVPSFTFWQLWRKRDSLSVSGRADSPSAGRTAVPGTISARVGFRAGWACAPLRCNMDMFRPCDHSRQVTFTAIQDTKFWSA